MSESITNSKGGAESPSFINVASLARKNVRAILFDMDGVLVNNLEVHRAAFAEFFRRYGVERSFDELSRVFGKGNDDIMGELMPKEEQSDFCHRIVQFGRDVCSARAPKCGECPLRELCEMGRETL